MAQRRVRIVLLCEDSRQENFIRKFLKKTGWQMREMIVRKSPSADGSAEQYIRKQFPTEFRAYRARSASTVLIAVVDGDKAGCKERMNAIENDCRNELGLCRNDTDSVAILVPTRNIETWIYHLKGYSVNESDDYKTIVSNEDSKSAAENLYLICSKQKPVDDMPNSLQAACTEYNKRILPVGNR